tara:strand:+ start:8080 stop:9285 length:1206 start_codon:yes stop_codon:yes gene_type:complete
VQFNKSYRLLRFLNRPHNVVERYLLAALGWLGALLTTRSLVLAAGLFREFRDDSFDIAFRKAARYARHLTPKLDVFNDPFFDFTMGTTAQERRALARLAERSAGKFSGSMRLTDLMYIKAANIHFALEQGEQPEAEIESYYRLADQVLANLPEPAINKGRVREPRPPDFCRQDGVQALRDIAGILPLDQWPWYVMSGTFLGLHRENGFLGHDYDIDLGINAEQIDVESLLACLRKQTLFAMKKSDSHVEVIRDEKGRRQLRKQLSLIKLIHPNGLHLDIFIHYTDDGSCWHGSIIHRWENSPFGLIRREMEGVTVNAPEDADRYLTENYGDWRTPVTDFDCTTGTPNLVVSRNFISVALFVKRLAYFCAHDPDQAGKLSRTLVQSNVLCGSPEARTMKKII